MHVVSCDLHLALGGEQESVMAPALDVFDGIEDELVVVEIELDSSGQS